MGEIKFEELAKQYKVVNEPRVASSDPYNKFMHSAPVKRTMRTPFYIAFPTILGLVIGTTYLMGKALTVEFEEEEEQQTQKIEMKKATSVFAKPHEDETEKMMKRMQTLATSKPFENRRVPRPDE